MRGLILAATLAATVAPAAAAGLPRCAPALLMLRVLAGEFHERPVHMGEVGPAPVVVTVSPGGSWTLLMAQAPGVLCIITSGEGWRPAGTLPPYQFVPRQEGEG